MSYLREFPVIEQETIKCMKCGNCQAVCPLYKELKSEQAVARGKVKLTEAVLEKQLPYTQKLAKIFELCLQCKACAVICPCGVEPDKIVLAARAKLVQERGLPTVKKMIFKVVSNPGLFKTGLAVGARTQGLFFKQREDGQSTRIPISGIVLRRVIPKLAIPSFLGRVPENNTFPGATKTIAFFSGCTTNFAYPGVGTALIEVMKRNNINVIVPKAQHCCGLPVLMHGDVETATQMAKSSVDIFSKYDVDAIITVCGTCGESFRVHYPELLQKDPAYYAKAKALAEKTYDFAQYLVDVIGLDPKKLGRVEATVTYHVPCHIGRSMKAKDQQLKIITSIPGVKYRPLRDPDRCCGGAGSFSLTHYDLSYDILKHKLDDIAFTDADYVITGCGSCRMQLNDGIAQEKMTQKVMHTVELLARSYQNA